MQKKKSTLNSTNYVVYEATGSVYNLKQPGFLGWRRQRDRQSKKKLLMQTIRLLEGGKSNRERKVMGLKVGPDK